MLMKTRMFLLLTPFWLNKRASQFPNNIAIPNNLFTYCIRIQKMHFQVVHYYISTCAYKDVSPRRSQISIKTIISCTHLQGQALQSEVCCLIPIHTLNSESKSCLMAEFQQPESSWADNHGQRSEGTPKGGEQWSGAPLCWLIMGSCSEEQAILYHHKVNVSKPWAMEGISVWIFFLWQKVKGAWKRMNSNEQGVLRG